MQNVSMFVLALYVVHGAASAPAQDIDRLLHAESEGDRRREGQDTDEDPAAHDPALAHLLEILGHHAHKPEAKQGGKRRLETTSSVDKDHGCTNVAYANMVFGKDYYHTIEDLGSPANPTDGWPLCARECNNDRDCLAWDWTLCVGNAKMCCNLIHTHYFIEDLQWRHNSLVNVDYYRSFSGIPCAPRYIYDIPEGKIFSLTSDIYSTVTWEIRNEVWTYDTVVGAGCRVKTAGDITRQPSESDSDLLVVPPGTDAYRVHIDNEDFWNKSYCQKVTCEETSLNEKRYAELHGQPIPEREVFWPPRRCKKAVYKPSCARPPTGVQKRNCCCFPGLEQRAHVDQDSKLLGQGV